MHDDPRVEMVEQLFAAWSSGDPDAPERFFHPDGVLRDIVGGEHAGWAAIRAFFGNGLQRWPDLVLAPAEFWTNERGVSVRWTMSATVTDARPFGTEHVGRSWTSEGMSWIVVEDGKVRLEVDYHDSAASAKSLGISRGR
jgi:ketosteroid isomerase-like protein